MWPRVLRRPRCVPLKVNGRQRSCAQRGTARRRYSSPRAAAQAIETVYAAINKGDPNPTLVAILQLDALAKFADSDNAKIVVPFEAAGLLGAA